MTEYTIHTLANTGRAELMYSEFYGTYFDKRKHQNEATNETSSGRGLSVTIRGKENLCAGMVDSSRIRYLIKSYNLIYISWHVAMWFGKNNTHKTPVGAFWQEEKWIGLYPVLLIPPWCRLSVTNSPQISLGWAGRCRQEGLTNNMITDWENPWRDLKRRESEENGLWF